MLEDSRIIELYWERDEAAIVETDRKYGDFCRRIARNILSVAEDAEECVSDVYHQAWNAIPPQRPEHLRVWLGRVARNNAVNLYHKNHAQKRYAGMEQLLDELAECIPSAQSVEEEIEGRELTGLINAWLSSLPQDDRILFLRRYWNGEALNALEKEWGVSHGRMAKRMYRLRQNLKQSLEKEGYSL